MEFEADFVERLFDVVSGDPEVAAAMGRISNQVSGRADAALAFLQAPRAADAARRHQVP